MGKKVEAIYNNPTLDNLDNEEWIDIIGFDGIYEVSNLGRIKSLGRWVSNGKSERWVKERIKKQVKVKDGRLTCPLNHGNIATSINIPAIVYLSFNPNDEYDVTKDCVMHIDKNQCNNRLENLKITPISKSHHINFKKGLLPHLAKNNEKQKLEYLKLTNKTCVNCNKTKKINFFEHGRNKCIECRKIEKSNRYYNLKKNI